MTYFINPLPHSSSSSEGRVGVLLINLGTPEATDYFSVRRYLKEFLSDRRVVEMPPLLWQPILQSFVLTRRPFKTGKNYKRIWNRAENASPLRVYTERQAYELAARFEKESIPVGWAMRYGKPSIEEAVSQLMRQGCDRIISLPLYPQYSASTTATAQDQLFRYLMRLRRQPSIVTVPSFPDHPIFIKALAESVKKHLGTLDFKPQRLIISFHGVPEFFIKKGDPYQDECFRTAEALRKKLGLTEEQAPVTFQSRFGPTEWIKPYTAPFVQSLPQKGITKIAVITPGFMTDCIETLDEIGRELREEFLEVGGQDFAYIPCLNESEGTIDLLEALSRHALKAF
ncbi:ferrochelatase [Aristophania vespae]|uniref:ferrochelatase n=1 Tax=Aristophania vespae TaxID=2697033 RepID=UPI0023517DD5|nr:ferrochelatase [Aristophania vespae]UMM63775.1 Ferrochelatase [Aristophania vespae]